MEKPDDTKKSSPEASKDLSMAIIPYEAPVPLKEVSPKPTKEERRDPMVWLSRHLPELFKKE